MNWMKIFLYGALLPLIAAPAFLTAAEQQTDDKSNNKVSVTAQQPAEGKDSKEANDAKEAKKESKEDKQADGTAKKEEKKEEKSAGKDAPKEAAKEQTPKSGQPKDEANKAEEKSDKKDNKAETKETKKDDAQNEDPVAENEDEGEIEDEDEDEEVVLDDAKEDTPDDKNSRPKYVKDLTWGQIEQYYEEDPKKLGSISLGAPGCGGQMNSVEMPEGKNWFVTNPAKKWGTQETVDYIQTAINAVVSEYPDTWPLAVGNLSALNGGKLRPHRSHQSGRDVDLGFYFKTGVSKRFAYGNKSNLDLPRNWALMKALISKTDVQIILLDRSIQKLLYDYALSIGEDKDWLDTLFKRENGNKPLIQHVRRHRNHYHVRFYNPRAQKLGIIVTKLAEKKANEPPKETDVKDKNAKEKDKEPTGVMHKVKQGECLGSIARKYGTTVTAIMKANRLRRNLINAGRVYFIPTNKGGIAGVVVESDAKGGKKRMRAACKVVENLYIPPRRLPPKKGVSFHP